jgi:hypothetical protein
MVLLPLVGTLMVPLPLVGPLMVPLPLVRPPLVADAEVFVDRVLHVAVQTQTVSWNTTHPGLVHVLVEQNRV